MGENSVLRRQFDELFRSQYTRLFRYALTLLEDQEAAKDVVSEVFAQLWNKIDEIDMVSVESYLMVSVKNRCLSHFRALAYREAYAENFVKIYNETYTDYSDELDKDRLVMHMLEALQPPAKEMVEAYYLEGRKQTEIAESMGFSVDTVKKYIMNARNKLREMFKDYNND